MRSSLTTNPSSDGTLDLDQVRALVLKASQMEWPQDRILLNEIEDRLVLAAQRQYARGGRSFNNRDNATAVRAIFMRWKLTDPRRLASESIFELFCTATLGSCPLTILGWEHDKSARNGE